MRYLNWDRRLTDYIASVRQQPFDWASFHCLNFANDALIVQGGEGFTDSDLFKFKTAKGAVRCYNKMLKKYGKTDMAGLMDAMLVRNLNTMPPRGAIVGRKSDWFVEGGIDLGVSVGTMVVFLGPEKLFFSEPKEDDIFWMIPDA